jgi:hypothetical protein
VIWHEQGFGDTIQFVRYAKLCKERAARVCVLCPTELIALVKSCPFVDDATEAVNAGDRTAHWTATLYPGPKGNWVFNASTIFWSQGMSSPPGHTLPWSHWSRPHGPDPRVQRTTQN